MYKINVVNKYKHKPTPNDWYCGRPNPLGNRFSHRPKKGLAEIQVATREESIQRYEQDFPDRMEQDKAFRDEFNRIREHLIAHGEVNLLCYCAPLSCHCDVIKTNLEDSLS